MTKLFYVGEQNTIISSIVNLNPNVDLISKSKEIKVLWINQYETCDKPSRKCD
jgi:hypothetical protein